VYGSSVGLEVVLPWIDTFKQASHMHAQGCPFSETHCGRVVINCMHAHETHPLGLTRYTERARMHRVSVLQELGSNDPIRSHT
jgi:hypothetical protein